MINNVFSCAGKWASKLGSNAYEIVIHGVVVSTVYTIAAAVSLPFRILGCCNRGEYFDNYKLKENLSNTGGDITGGIAKSILNIINPYAQIGYPRDSMGTKALAYFTSKTIDKFASSEYFFHRQVTTSLCYALKAPAAAAARAYDAVIGTVALVHAALLLGTDDNLNNRAFSYACGTGKIVGDLFECVLGFFGPTSAFPKTYYNITSGFPRVEELI